MMSFAEAWIDLETVILSETNQKNKNKYCVISIVCGIQRNNTDELIGTVETQSHVQKINLWLPSGERSWGELGDWD